MIRVNPMIVAPLDPAFQPPVLFNRAYRERVAAANAPADVVLGLERENGRVSRFETKVLPPGADDADTFRYIERVVKFLLWARGGWRIYFAGPSWLGDRLERCYARGSDRGFDVDLMERVYEKRFEIVRVAPRDVPPARELAAALGGHLDGCRIGFDLGASDYKVAAVRDGRPVFSEEYPWDPRNAADPCYHIGHIRAGLEKAAAHLPRVDAIGGSSAGVIVQNKIMVASLFRAVPPGPFASQVKPMFLKLREEWGVPVEVANDGDVTALAGAMSLNRNAMLGVAMGSSQAGGFLDAGGRILGWLTELAFAPVDFNQTAQVEEWSGDRGVGALYFSQQAVNKLAPASGMAFPDGMGLPERLKKVQDILATGDPAAARIFETIGVYLGYTIPYYLEFYDFDNLLVLGRVTSGRGGDLVIANARTVLETAFPDIAARVTLHVPDEKSRRVGQAVAAASLPVIGLKSAAG